MRRALLVAAGQMPGRELMLDCAEKADYKIAIDGGLKAFEAYGVRPDLLVGDMDSVPQSLLERYAKSGVPIYRAPVEKNETDGMLALDVAMEKGADEACMLGATGGRIDHLLSNLMLLKRACMKGVFLRICDEFQEISLHKGTFWICGTKGQTISILPMNEKACVNASGLYYPLDNLLLTNDKPRGVSNILMCERAEITSDDYVLIFKNKKA